MRLDALYHWAPAERFARINRRGLRINARPTVGTFRSGYLCLGLSPSAAWGLSADIFGEPGQEWDLWQVRLFPEDEVHVRPFWGNQLEEIRVHNDLPKSRVWHAGRKACPARRLPRRR